MTTESTTTDVVDLLAAEAKHVQQEIAAAVPHAGLADLKRRPRNPKPTVGFIAVCPGWDPRDRQDAIALWNQHPNVKAAETEVKFANLVGSPRTVIVEVTTSFRVLESETDAP